MCFMVITPALKGIALSNRSNGLVETGLCGAGLSMAARPAWCLVDLVLRLTGFPVTSHTPLPLLHTGSISSCDAFLNVFQSRGLRPEVICPCASSPEALTVAIRR